MHLNWKKVAQSEGGLGTNLKIPLFADNSKEMSRKYGILVENPNDELYGADLRGLYIIDNRGIVR